MSDDDFMMDDAGSYDFDYEDDDVDGEEEQEVGLENQYYNAKVLKEDEPEKAMQEFEAIVAREEERGEWGFKAIKQIVKLNYKRGNLEKALESYKELLLYIKSAVTRNYSEKSVNNLLDLVSTTTNIQFMEQFYAVTLESLENAKNERLWFRTNLKLAKMWLDRKAFAKLDHTLKKLHEACQTDDGSDDQRKGTHLLEVYAMGIQMYTLTKDNKKLKELYLQSLEIKSAIPHPRIMGIIRECGGKMHMSEGNFELANTDFFESFRSYDEAGSFERIRVLKYLVLANMLSESEIDPFDSQETKPYRDDPQIMIMTNLVAAYQRKELGEFHKVLKDHESEVMNDPFIRAYLDDVVKSIRCQALVKLQMGIDADEVQRLLVIMILDDKLDGAIDYANQFLEINRSSKSSHRRYEALEKWASHIDALQKPMLQRLAH